MSFKGASVVLVTCFLIHFFYCLDTPSYFVENDYSKTVLAVHVSNGISLLLFPVFGWLADVCFTRHRMIRASLIILTSITSAVVLFTIVFITMYELRVVTQHVWITIMASFIFIFWITGVGMFEANAIQFGLDQLLEASSSQLSAFVHWYYWSMHLGQLLFYLIAVIVGFSVSARVMIGISDDHYLQDIGTALLCVTWMSVIWASFLLFHHCKKYFYIERVGRNPLKQVWDVLKFSWLHKYPLRRSAFTYCEEKLPSRLDLGKEHYGGPFTTEEVEDVKTLLKLLLLLATLFGFHIAGDGFTIAQHMEQYGCPSIGALGLVVHVFNPICISSLVVLVSIPLMQFMPHIHRCSPSMLKRIGIGMLILLVQEISYTSLAAIPLVDPSVSMRNVSSVFPESVGIQCYFVLNDIAKNGSDANYSDAIDSTFLWLIGPQILNGVAQVLVNMTVLEFLCAQAPRTMQGLIIGLWYSMFSIRYLLMKSLDSIFISSSFNMFIYQAVRSVLILISLFLYVCFSRNYQYRVRDWVVNVQWMVDDVFERRMAQEERYMRQQLIEQEAMIEESSRNGYDSSVTN